MRVTPRAVVSPVRDRRLEAGGNEALGSQVVDLRRPVVANDGMQTRLIQQVRLLQHHLVQQVFNTVVVKDAGAAHHAHDLVTLRQEEFGQITAVTDP